MAKRPGPTVSGLEAISRVKTTRSSGSIEGNAGWPVALSFQCWQSIGVSSSFHCRGADDFRMNISGPSTYVAKVHSNGHQFRKSV